MIAIVDKPGVSVNGPEDPALARLWSMALSKFRRAADREPATTADVREVTALYHALLAKRCGSLGGVVDAFATQRGQPVPDQAPGSG